MRFVSCAETCNRYDYKAHRNYTENMLDTHSLHMQYFSDQFLAKS